MVRIELARPHDPQMLADVRGLLHLAVRHSSDTDRAQANRDLVKAAGSRTRLEELHEVFVDRLHQRSSDFDGSLVLVVTIRELRALDAPSGCGGS